MNGAGYRIRTCGARRTECGTLSLRACPDLLRAAGATRGRTTTFSRRCFTAARPSASELLKSCTVRCAAPPVRGAGKTKSPVGLRTHRAWIQCLRGLSLQSSTPARCARAIRLRLAEMQARQSKSGHRVDVSPDAIRPPAQASSGPRFRIGSEGGRTHDSLTKNSAHAKYEFSESQAALALLAGFATPSGRTFGVA